MEYIKSRRRPAGRTKGNDLSSEGGFAVYLKTGKRDEWRVRYQAFCILNK